MDGVVDNTHQVPASEKPEITSAPTSGSALEEPTASDGITWQSFEHETNASCQWSKPYSLQVRRLKNHWRKVLKWTGAWVDKEVKQEEVEQEEVEQEEVEQEELKHNLKNSPWFARAVLQLRNAPCLESCEVEIDQSLRGFLVSGSKLTSLNLAILMQDTKLVKEILKKCPSPNNGIHRPLVDPQRAMNFLKVSTTNLVKNAFLFTPLHLAVTVESRFIMGPLLEKGVDVNVPNWLLQTPLELAAKLVDKCYVDCLLNGLARADVMKYKKKMPLHILATKPYYRFDVKQLIETLDGRSDIDLKALDEFGLSAFYLAILCCNTKFVNALLEHFKDRIRLNEECINALGPPIQIAFEGGDDFKDIERALMECEPVKGYIDKLYRDRQVYVDAANAILVGAALIASVTFASWLQPPLNYTSYSGEEGYSSSIPTSTTSNLNYVDVEHNIPLRAFWIFNALSFYFAIGSVICGARSVLPRSHLFIKKIVERLRANLLVTSVLLACSMLFVIIAFAIAGTIVLTPSLKYQWYMIIPTLVGGVVCIISLVFMVKSMREIFSDKRGKSEPFNSRRIDCLHNRGYTVQESSYILE